MTKPRSIRPDSPAGIALRSLCQYKGPASVPPPIAIGRRRSRPEIAYLALVRQGMATVQVLHGARMYQPTDTGRALAATWIASMKTIDGAV